MVDFEADLVSHSGPVGTGSFVQTLVLTDIATGWTECAPLLVREQRLLTEVLSELRKLLPFPLLGLDTDSDSVFMNETVRDYCLDAGVEFTRCRPYRKNDQAWVEQKNGSVVRRTVGYRRFERHGTGFPVMHGGQPGPARPSPATATDPCNNVLPGQQTRCSESAAAVPPNYGVDAKGNRGGEPGTQAGRGSTQFSTSSKYP